MDLVGHKPTQIWDSMGLYLLTLRAAYPKAKPFVFLKNCSSQPLQLTSLFAIFGGGEKP